MEGKILLIIFPFPTKKQNIFKKIRKKKSKSTFFCVYFLCNVFFDSCTEIAEREDD